VSAEAAAGGPTLVALAGPATDRLADALAAREVWVVPPPPALDGAGETGGETGGDTALEDGWPWAPELTAWREELAGNPASDGIVVCAWPASADPGADSASAAGDGKGALEPVRLVDLPAEAWLTRAEWSLGAWFAALQVAADHCADGGSIVVVTELPFALDAAGHGPLVAVGEGLATAARSLAFTVGERGVRVNVVTTELWTVPDRLTGPAPALASFPGDVDSAAGVVRFLLGPDSGALTGTVTHADFGRSL
jgi:NAD(P)-dependent dehydrogenase (short-subunit alcohol dehydrogenase family)